MVYAHPLLRQYRILFIASPWAAVSRCWRGFAASYWELVQWLEEGEQEPLGELGNFFL